MPKRSHKTSPAAEASRQAAAASDAQDEGRSKKQRRAADPPAAQPRATRSGRKQQQPQDAAGAPAAPHEAPDKAKPAGRAAAGRKARSAAAHGADAKAAAQEAPQAQAPAEEPSDPPRPRGYLMKSEPDEFSVDDLAAKPNQTSCWEGVRNAQARNIMRGMRVGDEVLFYHSSCKVPAAVGLARVARTAYPDFTAWDPASKYYDPKSPETAPKWHMVDVQLVRKLARPVTLEELRAAGAKGEPVKDMWLLHRSRLSVQPVSEAEWEYIMQLEKQPKSG